jgi:uncharacterized protein YjaG (DUF416 family)
MIDKLASRYKFAVEYNTAAKEYKKSVRILKESGYYDRFLKKMTEFKGTEEEHKKYIVFAAFYAANKVEAVLHPHIEGMEKVKEVYFHNTDKMLDNLIVYYHQSMGKKSKGDDKELRIQDDEDINPMGDSEKKYLIRQRENMIKSSEVYAEMLKDPEILKHKDDLEDYVSRNELMIKGEFSTAAVEKIFTNLGAILASHGVKLDLPKYTKKLKMSKETADLFKHIQNDIDSKHWKKEEDITALSDIYESIMREASPMIKRSISVFKSTLKKDISLRDKINYLIKSLKSAREFYGKKEVKDSWLRELEAL